MKIILSHPTGNANVRAVAQGFADAGVLHKFYTSIATFPGDILYGMGRISPLSDFRRRSYDLQLKEYIKTYGAYEVGRLLSSKLKLKSLTKHETGRFSVDSVYRNLDKRVAQDLEKQLKYNINAVYAYEDGALETFKEAKRHGLTCIYDLPIAYWEKSSQLLQEEQERLPDWAITLGGGISDSERKRDRKKEEMEMADIIVCPSRFVRDSVPIWAQNKHLIEAPFGTPQISHSLSQEKPMREGRLRVLFVGSMGQRKGLGDLFLAMKMLDSPNVELVVLGSPLASIDFYRHKLHNFTYEPVRSHGEVLELMDTCDVFCLPSIVEGRALVMQEAMSRGLPLIVTPNTGGSDLVIEGETGFLVPIRSPEKIAEKINWFIENRGKIHDMSQNSQKHALKYSWKAYSNTIFKEIEALI